MGAYFHQDWIMDGGEVTDTVAVFMEEPPETVAAAADEIDQLLAQDLAEGELAQQLRAMGSAYRAGERDSDYRLWLLEVRDEIRHRLDQT